MDITDVEHTKKTAQEMKDGRTVALADGKTFVLCRFREPMTITISSAIARRDLDSTRPSKVVEVLVWLHPDDL
jgi:hypothetical protein